MKFLLTSAGITNNSIRKALVDLLDKPIEESKALCIPIAVYAESWRSRAVWTRVRMVAEFSTWRLSARREPLMRF